MRFLFKSRFSINRFYIFLMLILICILMLIIEAIFPKTLSNHLLNREAFHLFNRHSEFDDDLQRLKDYEADLDDPSVATPKLPFALDQFGDYNPVFLSHKVVHLNRALTKNEKNFFKNLNDFRNRMSKVNVNELLKVHLNKKSLNNKNDVNQTKSSINKPPFQSSTTSAYLIERSSSKQPIIKRHMLASLNLAAQPKKSLNLNNLERLTDAVKKLNEQNPLSLLRIEAKEVININRIYLLSYFRSGSSFLGDLLQQHYRTFYQFEPLHFRSVASRLPSNDTNTSSSISLVLNMLNQCNFHSKATANYLSWISKYDNKFLLSWNKFLYSLCKYNQTKCSDEKFVEQVCNLSEQRVTKLTRVNLNDLLSVMNSDNSFEDYLKMIYLNSTVDKLNFKIKTTNNTTNKTISSLKIVNSSLQLEVEPIKVIYLVRDPRAIYSSRQYLSWCKNRACTNIDKLCYEMNSDFKTFESFYLNSSNRSTIFTLTNSSSKYPIQMFLIRFELVALDPFRSTSELFKLVNLPFKENIKRFVYTHTANNLDVKNLRSPFKKWYLNKVSNDPHSTKRNSTKIPFDWIHKLTFNKIDEIQTKCKYSMDRLGYRSITNEQFKNLPTNLTDLLLTKTISYTLF